MRCAVLLRPSKLGCYLLGLAGPRKHANRIAPLASTGDYHAPSRFLGAIYAR
jgi:hypothetical protein